MDWMAEKHASTLTLHIYADSYGQLGTDNQAIGLTLRLEISQSKAREHIRLGNSYNTLPSTDPSTSKNSKDWQPHARDLPKALDAKMTGRPKSSLRWLNELDFLKTGNGHKERAQEHMRSGDRTGWKRLLRETGRHCLSASRTHIWDGNAEAMAPAEPHQCLHEHFQGIFSTGLDLDPLPEPTERSADFTAEELQEALKQGKMSKSVGEDGVSLELLKAIAEAEGGTEELLVWLNSLLHEGNLPEN